jgi:hypothetical protein
MISREDGLEVINRLREDFGSGEELGEDDMREWAERHGIDPDFFVEAVQTYTEGVRFLHESGLADFRQAVLSCITTAFISGFVLGEHRVPDASLPDIDNVYGEGDDE